MYYAAISLTVFCNILYHLCLKVTPDDINPFLSLFISYSTALVFTLISFFLFEGNENFIDNFKKANWASYALGFSILGLEIGFLLAYRAGWNINLAALFSNVTVFLFLIPIGLLLFKENLNNTNILGIIFCIIGILLISYKN